MLQNTKDCSGSIFGKHTEHGWLSLGYTFFRSGTSRGSSLEVWYDANQKQDSLYSRFSDFLLSSYWDPDDNQIYLQWSFWHPGKLSECMAPAEQLNLTTKQFENWRLSLLIHIRVSASNSANDTAVIWSCDYIRGHDPILLLCIKADKKGKNPMILTTHFKELGSELAMANGVRFLQIYEQTELNNTF